MWTGLRVISSAKTSTTSDGSTQYRRLEPAVHAGRPLVDATLLELLPERDPVSLAETAGDLGDGPEAVLLLVVDRAENGADPQRRPRPAPGVVADDRQIDGVFELAVVGALELDPVEIAFPRFVDAVDPLRDDALQPGAKLSLKELFDRSGLSADQSRRHRETAALLQQLFERGAPLAVRSVGEIVAVGVKQVERVEPEGQLLLQRVDPVDALALHGDLEWLELVGLGIVRERLAFQDRPGRTDLCDRGANEVRKHRRRVFLVPGKHPDLRPVLVDLAAEAVVLRFHRAGPEAADQLVQVLHAFRELHLDRTADTDLKALQRALAAAVQRLRDEPEVRAEVVAALDDRARDSLRARQTVEDRRVPDAQSHAAHRDAQQVLPLERRRALQQRNESGDLLLDAPLPRRPRQLRQPLVDLRDRQACSTSFQACLLLPQQLLDDESMIAKLSGLPLRRPSEGGRAAARPRAS